MVGRDAMAAAMFPPLAVERSEWSAPWHPFDEFFAVPQAKLAVVGEERLGDRRVYVLEHASEVTFKASWLLPEEIEKYGDRARRFSGVRAYVYPERGYLPVRMEWNTHVEYMGRRFPTKPHPPLKVIEDVEIALIENGGYYPTRGVVREYERDAQWKGPTIFFSDLIAGKPSEPMALNRVTRWTQPWTPSYLRSNVRVLVIGFVLTSNGQGHLSLWSAEE